MFVMRCVAAQGDDSSILTVHYQAIMHCAQQLANIEVLLWCCCRFRKLPEDQQEQLLRKLKQQQEAGNVQ